MRLGWVPTSSFPSGHAANAVHGLFMYVASLEEIMAGWFAELQLFVSASSNEKKDIYRHLRLNNADVMRQDRGEFFKKMRSVTGLLELLYHSNNNLIVDTLGVDFETFWWRSGFRRHKPAGAPWWFICELWRCRS